MSSTEAGSSTAVGRSGETSGWSELATGRLRSARARFWRGTAHADASGDPVALASAAMGLGGIWVHEHRDTIERAEVLALQHRALAGIDPSSPLAIRLRARLAAEAAYVTGETSSVLAVLAEARRSDDPVALADALSMAHHCLLGPSDGRLRMALADELVAVAPLTGRPLDALMGLMWRTVDLFLTGDRRAERSLRELKARLSEQRCDALTFVAMAMDVMLAIRAGRLTEAEGLADDCLRLGSEVGDADASGWHGGQLLAIRRLQGRSDEILPIVLELDTDPTVAEGNDSFTAAVAALAPAAGDLDAARSALARLRSWGLGNQPSPSVWLAKLLGAAEAAYALDDVDTADEVYALLEPYGSLPVMVSLAVVCFGSAHRPLGLAALTVGEIDLGVAHLEAACAADLAIGHGPNHAIDLATLAHALDRRGNPADRERAVDLRSKAVDEARSYGMHRRAEHWARRPASCRPRPAILVERQGRQWLVTCGDRAALVRHCIGLSYLAQLVSQPNRPVPAMELVANETTSSHCPAPQPVIDEVARDQYRRRATDLRAEIDEAETCADLERAARARLELDALVEQLSSGVGLNGRARAFPDDTERARTSVRKALTRALTAIAEADSHLAADIEARLETGIRCTFHSVGYG